MKLIWDITNKCNLRCIHCGAIELIDKEIEEYKDWKKVIDYVSSFVDSVSLLGGEPLLYPEIKELIEYCNKKSIEVMIITNGQICEKKIKDIMQLDIKSLLVSIEGLKETNDKIRGKGSWDKAMETLRLLVSLNKVKTRKVNLGVNIIANKLNKDDIIPFIEFTKDLDINYQIGALAIKGNAEKNADDLVMHENNILDLYEMITNYKIEHLEYKISFVDMYPIVSDYLNRKTGYNYEIKGLVCDSLLDAIYADPYGNICACRAYTDNKINVDKDHNWTQDFTKLKPFLEILHNNSKNEICVTCPYNDICIPCPLKENFETPGICKEALKQIKTVSIPIESTFELCKPYAILDSSDYYEIYYPSLGTKTEYSIEGLKILNAIIEPKTLQEISNEVSYPPDIIYKFLQQEKASDKVIEHRKRLTS